MLGVVAVLHAVSATTLNMQIAVSNRVFIGSPPYSARSYGPSTSST
jgi:hypothetical protein